MEGIQMYALYVYFFLIANKELSIRISLEHLACQMNVCWR